VWLYSPPSRVYVVVFETSPTYTLKQQIFLKGLTVRYVLKKCSPLYGTQICGHVTHKSPILGPVLGQKKPNPNLYFCKIRGIIICDNAALIKFIKIAFKTSVSTSQKTPSLHYKVDQITASWRSKYVYFEGDKQINTLYGKDALSPKLNSAQIRDNQAPGILV